MDQCDLNVVMIGDRHQSIYGFRGAKPELFRNLPNRNFSEFNIDVSVRCHESVLALSYSLFDKDRDIDIVENCVFIDEIYSDFEKLKSLDKNFFILVESKVRARSLYDRYLSEGLDVVYSEGIDYDSGVMVDYKDDYMDFIEESLRYFYNVDNMNSKSIYSSEEYIDFIENSGFSTKRIKRFLVKQSDEKSIDFLIRISKLVELDFNDTLINELQTQLKNPVCANHYLKTSDKNRIMTLHASKGLECSKVIVVLEYNQYNLKYEYLRKCFVGFTRAIDSLHICFIDKAVGSLNERYIKLLHSRL